jgi:nitrite reductase/ring-hydroxylating ferredoxin subunit
MSQDPMQNACERLDEPCAVQERRDFLRLGLMAVGALAALGATPDRLAALERRFATGRRVGSDLRFPLPTADGATVDRTNNLILARFNGEAIAFVLECPHRGENVRWQANNNRFFCPKHESTFQPNGARIQGKAERGMDRYAMRREGNELVVTITEKIRSTNAAAWMAAAVAL